MAYSFWITQAPVQTLDGVKYRMYTIDEADVTDADEWVIMPISPRCSLVLFEAAIVEQPASGSVGMQPRLMRKSLHDADPSALLIASRRALPTIRNEDNVRLECPHGALYGQSRPGATRVPSIRTRITLVGGH